MVQGSEVQRLTDSGCLPSEISGTCLRATHRQIEKNREAINPEHRTLNLRYVMNKGIEDHIKIIFNEVCIRR
jgi:hypothetical protein